MRVSSSAEVSTFSTLYVMSGAIQPISLQIQKKKKFSKILQSAAKCHKVGNATDLLEIVDFSIPYRVEALLIV